jgi:hypothetical protein
MAVPTARGFRNACNCSVLGASAPYGTLVPFSRPRDPDSILAVKLARPFERLAVLAALAASPLTAHAQARDNSAEAPSHETAAPAFTSTSDRPARWGFNASLGAGGAKGEFSSLLQRSISGDFSIFRTQGPWRFGLGINFGSFNMKKPYVDGLEWGLQEDYLSATRMLRTEGSFRPYLQVRGGLARLHPRSHLFDEVPLPEGFVLGDSPTRAASGYTLGLVPGFEWNLTRSVALDLSASLNYFNVGAYDLAPVGLSPAHSGSTFEGRIGLRWHPDNGYPSGPRASVEADGPRDAWGNGKNYGWAAAQVLAINWVAAASNEHTRNGNLNQVNPRSWKWNIANGFTYDDNDFRTNQFIHSYNGNAYFSAARSNGLGFWTSAAYATGGAFFWECCGETHPISYNDMIATSIGGFTLGEMTYRLSSEILGNQATGAKRVFKEIGAFVVNPVRGLNRLISGRSSSVYDTPKDPMDWRPPRGSTLLGVGVRIIGQDSIKEGTQTYGNLVFDHTYGNPYDNPRRKPFDYSEIAMQLTAGEKWPLTILRIRGDLWEKPLGDEANPKHVFAITQFFDYQNNNTYEFGGQSVAATLHSRFRLAKNVRLKTHASLLGLSLGAVNSDYAAIANVADRERLREYDYGPGLGFDSVANVVVKDQTLLTFTYRFQWISVSNGSVYSRGQSSLGSDANHYVQYGSARFFIPIIRKFGLGADGFVFLRKSRYSDPAFEDINQRTPRLRVFLAFNSYR